MRIALLSGTNRPGSNTRKVVKHLEAVYRAAGVDAPVLDLVDLPPTLFAPEAYAEHPAAFTPFADTFLRADGVHVVVPEYNGGAPGVLKYFIDMLKYPESFARKPVAFTGLSAGIWGAFRPVEHLESLFINLGSYVYPERVFLPGIATHLEEDGSLSNPVSIKRLQTQASGFVDFAARLKKPVEA